MKHLPDSLSHQHHCGEQTVLHSSWRWGQELGPVCMGPSMCPPWGAWEAVGLHLWTKRLGKGAIILQTRGALK